MNNEPDKERGDALIGHLLILTGLLQVVTIQIPAIGTILALLAIAAGALILVGRLSCSISLIAFLISDWNSSIAL